MPIYNHFQYRLSFAAESGRGGYLELAAGGGAVVNTRAATESATILPGARSIGLANVTGLAAGDYVQIEVDNTIPTVEIRRIVSVDATNTRIYLDYPLGFSHSATVTVAEYNVVSNGATGINLVTFLPGVYTNITAPDLNVGIDPQYSISTSQFRNWNYAYPSKSSFIGTIPDMILLNGYPLRFAIGGVYTTVTGSFSGGSSTLSANSIKGQREIFVGSALNFAIDDFILIGDNSGNTNEVRRISHISGTALRLNYPLMFAHTAGDQVREIAAGAIYTHTIREFAELDTITWEIRARDTGETAANDFARRYVGGIVNQATISAKEGDMLRMSWDEVIFTDLLHNQVAHSSVTGDIERSSRAMQIPSVGGDLSTGLGTLVFGGLDGAATSYPTTEPYYFSQGNISLFGINFARVRGFSLSIQNNIQPFYAIRSLPNERTPFLLLESMRNYKLNVNLAMEDSIANTSTTRTLWKELILEGNYGSVGATEALQGFSIELLFTRGVNDTIRIRSPIDQAPSSSYEDQGCFFMQASHDKADVSPLEVSGEILMRNLEIVITDAVGVYP